MESQDRPPRRRIGRPLSFDREAALHQAMLLFWRHGYEATSLAELTAAMGVTPPSIYAAYGDKKRLFLEAVRRYLTLPAEPGQAAAPAGTARQAALDLLQGAAVRFTGPHTPPGCLVATAAIGCSPAAADVQAELSAIRHTAERMLRERIGQAIDTGELPAPTDSAALAAHVMAVVQGMSTLARDGAPRDKLMRLAATAMQAWPQPNPPPSPGRPPTPQP